MGASLCGLACGYLEEPAQKRRKIKVFADDLADAASAAYLDSPILPNGFNPGLARFALLTADQRDHIGLRQLFCRAVDGHLLPQYVDDH